MSYFSPSKNNKGKPFCVQRESFDTTYNAPSICYGSEKIPLFRRLEYEIKYIHHEKFYKILKIFTVIFWNAHFPVDGVLREINFKTKQSFCAFFHHVALREAAKKILPLMTTELRP